MTTGIPADFRIASLDSPKRGGYGSAVYSPAAMPGCSRLRRRWLPYRLHLWVRLGLWALMCSLMGWTFGKRWAIAGPLVAEGSLRVVSIAAALRRKSQRATG